MMTLVINTIVSKRNKLLIMLYMVLVFVFLITLIPFGDSETDLYFYKNSYNLEYNTIVIQIMKIFSLIFSLLIIGNHDQKYLNNLTTHVRRQKVLMNKLMTYAIFLIANIVFIIYAYYVSLKIFDYQELFNPNILQLGLFIYIDNIIFVLIGLLIVKADNRLGIHLVFVVYYVIGIIHNTDPNLLIYYIVPFHGENFLEYSKNSYYQICYAVFLIIVNVVCYSERDIK